MPGLFAQTRAPQEPMKPLHPLEESYLRWNLAPADQAYASIDGRHLKGYVEDQSAISRRYRDNGHPQFWGRIAGTEADEENAQWLLGRFRKIGLSDVRQQAFDLPPQWMPQSWSVAVATDDKTLAVTSAQPTYRSPGTDGLDLEAVDAGFGTEGDLAGRDLRGKAVFFYSTDYFSRHSTINGGAIKRINDKGAASIFVILAVPGNIKTQFYPVGSKVPTFSLGLQDGSAIREMIGQARDRKPPRVKIKLDVTQQPGMKSSTVWGSLPGTSDETVFVIAHRDGWFEAANDNGTGVATMLGLAEFFAKIPKDRRRRTIQFLGTTGHHDGTAESGTWLAQHKEVFEKTALIINCEHTAANEMVLNNGVIQKSNWPSTLTWYVGGSPKLEDIVVKAYAAFGVPTYEIPARTPAGEIGRIYQFAPSIQLIDTGLYWHSDHETADIIPPTGLEASTRAYAKIIREIDAVDFKDLQRPPK
ncbi:MAG: M28 family peptidase [Acidobacteriia bacterium]|nr:M28 family peptidase [Terriglobia bacterium]